MFIVSQTGDMICELQLAYVESLDTNHHCVVCNTQYVGRYATLDGAEKAVKRIVENLKLGTEVFYMPKDTKTHKDYPAYTETLSYRDLQAINGTLEAYIKEDAKCNIGNPYLSSIYAKIKTLMKNTNKQVILTPDLQPSGGMPACL